MSVITLATVVVYFGRSYKDC